MNRNKIQIVMIKPAERQFSETVAHVPTHIDTTSDKCRVMCANLVLQEDGVLDAAWREVATMTSRLAPAAAAAGRAADHVTPSASDCAAPTAADRTTRSRSAAAVTTDCAVTSPPPTTTCRDHVTSAATMSSCLTWRSLTSRRRPASSAGTAGMC